MRVTCLKQCLRYICTIIIVEYNMSIFLIKLKNQNHFSRYSSSLDDNDPNGFSNLSSRESDDDDDDADIDRYDPLVGRR